MNKNYLLALASMSMASTDEELQQMIKYLQNQLEYRRQIRLQNPQSF